MQQKVQRVPGDSQGIYERGGKARAPAAVRQRRASGGGRRGRRCAIFAFECAAGSCPSPRRGPGRRRAMPPALLAAARRATPRAQPPAAVRVLAGAETARLGAHSVRADAPRASREAGGGNRAGRIVLCGHSKGRRGRWRIAPAPRGAAGRRRLLQQSIVKPRRERRSPKVGSRGLAPKAARHRGVHLLKRVVFEKNVESRVLTESLFCLFDSQTGRPRVDRESEGISPGQIKRQISQVLVDREKKFWLAFDVIE